MNSGETHSGVPIFRLADGRYHVINSLTVATLKEARAAAETESGVVVEAQSGTITSCCGARVEEAVSHTISSRVEIRILGKYFRAKQYRNATSGRID